MRPDDRKDLGYSGEGLALGYLFARGYRIRDRNWRHGRGELDLVCEDGRTIVFVEVKTRRTDRWGTALEAVDARKQRRLLALGRVYMGAHRGRPCRFDVVAIDLVGRRPVIRHLRGAFP